MVSCSTRNRKTTKNYPAVFCF